MDIVKQNKARHHYHSALPEITHHGQQRIEEARVAIVGVGALGSAIAEQLTRIGVGHILLIDGDYVSLDNLARQSLYNERHAAVKMLKVNASREILETINSDITVEVHPNMLSLDTCEEYLTSYDYIMDGTDNLEGRFLIDDWCQENEGKMWFFGGVGTVGGMFGSPIFKGTPYLRMIETYLRSVVENTDHDAGILTPIVSIIASAQVTQLIKSIIVPPSKRNSTQIWELDIWSLCFNTRQFSFQGKQ